MRTGDPVSAFTGRPWFFLAAKHKKRVRNCKGCKNSLLASSSYKQKKQSPKYIVNAGTCTRSMPPSWRLTWLQNTGKSLKSTKVAKSRMFPLLGFVSFSPSQTCWYLRSTCSNSGTFDVKKKWVTLDSACTFVHLSPVERMCKSCLVFQKPLIQTLHIKPSIYSFWTIRKRVYSVWNDKNKTADFWSLGKRRGLTLVKFSESSADDKRNRNEEKPAVSLKTYKETFFKLRKT